MIYLDTSVVLAHLLAEDRTPPQTLWEDLLVSSRLLEYESWTRIHALGLTQSHSEPTRLLLNRIYLVELFQPVLARALEPFPVHVRTLDALHLASLDYIRGLGYEIRLATYDVRMRDAAQELGMPLFGL